MRLNISLLSDETRDILPHDLRQLRCGVTSPEHHGPLSCFVRNIEPLYRGDEIPKRDRAETLGADAERCVEICTLTRSTLES
jgi:hypothetical protein